MNLKRFSATFLAIVALCGAALNVNARPAPRDLVAQLPASDIVMTVDLARANAQKNAVIGLLKPEIFAQYQRELDKFQRETGFDINSLETAAVGFTDANGTQKPQFVALVQGRFTASYAIESGLAAAERKNAKFRRITRQYEGFTVFLIPEGPRRKGSNEDNFMAVTALDGNTVAVGTYSAVRNAIGAKQGRARVSEEIVNLATRNSSATVSFGGNIPQDLLKAFTGTKKAEAEFLKGARQFAGSFDMTGLDSTGEVALIMENADQAASLSSAINGLRRMFAPELTKGVKGQKPESQAIRRIVDDAQITANANEVQLRVAVREADLRQIMPEIFQ